MSFNVGRELQKFIYGKLTTDAPLMALISGVFDFVPQSQAFPFIHIGEFNYNKQSTKGSELSEKIRQYEGTVQIDIWARPNPIGKAKVWDLINEVRRVLDGNRSMASTEYCLLLFDEDLSTVIVEPDSVTYHGVMTFRTILGGRE
jgi:hypothetical protein